MIYVGLPMCNIEELIPQVIEKLFLHTDQDFHLVLCDNSSVDSTVDKAMETIKSIWSSRRADKVNITLFRMPERGTALECTNFAMSLALQNEYVTVTKLDHDYGVPSSWDSVIRDVFITYPHFRLLSPSVVPETPKGMQFYSQGHKPEYVTEVPLSSSPEKTYRVYHYAGIAGYCHTVPQHVYSSVGCYRAMNTGAVFGSEDADFSIRSAPDVHTKGYIFELQGHHWDKPNVGVYESEYKGKATFLGTKLTLEEWMLENYPNIYEKYYKK